MPNITSIKVLGFLLIMLVIGIGVGYFIGISTQPTRIEVPKHPLDGQTLLIGVLHSNPVYIQGEQVAAEIAKEEIEAWLSTIGIKMNIVYLYENAEGSAAKARERFESLVARGVKFVVGFRWSSHVRACLDYANTHKVLIISDASTSPLLSVPDRGYLIRLPVDDNYQGKAIARMIIDYGVQHVAVLQRADAWGDGLYEVFEKRFKELNGDIITRIRYDPEKTEFSAEVKLLNDAISKAIATYGKDKVGFLFLGFEEDSVAVQSAALGYETLMSVIWFGSDGHVLAERLIKELGQYALKVRHISTYMGVAQSDLWARFAEKYKSKMGITPGTYDTLLYDSIWLLVKTIVLTGSMDPTVILKNIPTVAETSFGASGWLALNEFGDRREAVYDIWAIVESGEKPTPGQLGWAKIGTYDPISDKVTFLVKPSPK
jgi:branched-chain amino acid transport system substrate-binding protein